jgi:hypothetical protein
MILISFRALKVFYVGRYVFDLAFDHIIKVAATSHPSSLKLPEDLEVSSVILSK